MASRLLRSFVVAVALAACTPTTGAVVPEATPPPAPTGEVVLTVDGPRGPVDWDLAALATLDPRDVTVFEPFLGQHETFRVVDVDRVLASSGWSADAPLRLHALDDYDVDVSVAELRAGAALLAIAQDGEAIPLADGGPIRIVFTSDSELGRNEDVWIWSLRTVGPRP